MTGRLPVIGLHAILAREDCESLELTGDADAVVDCYDNVSALGWQRKHQSAHRISAEELVAEIESRVGVDVVKVRCLLPNEVVEYVVERGGVRITRSPRGSKDSPHTIAERYPEILEALGIPGTKRGYKFRQAAHFATLVVRALVSSRHPRKVRILDLACGRNYLGFLLLPVLRDHGFEITLMGIDLSPALVAKSREIAKNLGWSNVEFEAHDLRELSVKRGSYDMVTALHACDTLTDEAIRIAWEAQAEHLFAVPCCQSEMRLQLDDYPLDWISRYSVIEQRLADVLTDGFRCFVLEALGYGVRAVEFADSELTPKNLLIHAQRGTVKKRPPPATAHRFLSAFSVQPRLAKLLIQAQDGGAT